MTSPTCLEVLSKAGLEVIGMVALLMPLGYIYVFTGQYEPFHRGFFCDDQNLKHPYLEQTVPIVDALLIWAAASIIVILLVETLRSSAEYGKRRPDPIPGQKHPPWIAVEIYRHFGYFALGALGCLVFTEIAKYTIGRLRPHFLTLCQPNLGPELCDDEYGYKKFVTEDEDVICMGLERNGGNTTKKQLHEARLSFLSGHSSFSFYCGTFLIVYLQARLTNFPECSTRWVSLTYRLLKVFRPFIQFAMIILAFWISLTRISDYFHHPMDVVTGAIVGIGFAGMTLLVIADVFNRKSSFWKTIMTEDSEPSQSNIIFSHNSMNEDDASDIMRRHTSSNKTAVYI